MTNAAQDDVEHEGRTVGVTAALLGVTVRALYHWDEIGLVRASARTAAGYRLYTGADIARARRVLVYRELGVALDEIGELLDAPASATDSLRRQRDRVRAYAARLNRTAEALDRLIAAREEGILLSDEEQAEIFGDHWGPEEVADEVRGHGGDPSAATWN
ncbi:MerR family transcriptional regulator [Nocardia sp. NPDC003345]